MRKKTVTAIVISVFAVSLWAVPTAGAWWTPLINMNQTQPTGLQILHYQKMEEPLDQAP